MESSETFITGFEIDENFVSDSKSCISLLREHVCDKSPKEFATMLGLDEKEQEEIEDTLSDTIPTLEYLHSLSKKLKLSIKIIISEK